MIDIKYSEELDKVVQSAIDKYGAPNQYVVALEELAELSQAITKTMRYYKNNEYKPTGAERDNLIEEMADVCIGLISLTKLAGVSFDEVNAGVTYKADRLKWRVANG